MKDRVSQYVPSFYKREFGENNIVSVSAEMFNQILEDIRSFAFNNWDKVEILRTEFLTDKIIKTGFKIKQPQFLKSFYKFKGTNSDIQYILNNLGYGAVIYNDGGILHQDNRDDLATQEIIDIQEMKTMPNPCEIDIQIQIDLDSEEFVGYLPTDIQPVKDIVNERLNLCAYLSKMYVALKKQDEYNTTKEIVDEFVLVSKVDKEISVFTEQFLDFVKYGKHFNGGVKYGTGGKIYGQHKISHILELGDLCFVSYMRDVEFAETYYTELMGEIVDIRIVNE